VRQPVNTIDPYKSLLTPLYNYDVDRMAKRRPSLQRDTTQKSLATVADTDDESTEK